MTEDGARQRLREAWRGEITASERFWIEIIRLASHDRDPPPTLKQVQQLCSIFCEPLPERSTASPVVTPDPARRLSARY